MSLLPFFRAAFVTVTADGERLRFRPKERMTDDLRALAREHRADLLAELATPYRFDCAAWLRAVGAQGGPGDDFFTALAWLTTHEARWNPPTGGYSEIRALWLEGLGAWESAFMARAGRPSNKKQRKATAA